MAKSKIVDKHKIVIKQVMENSGIVPVRLNDELLKVGYSPAYIRSGSIKKTKSWKDLMEKYIGDDKLAKLHSRILKKEELIVVDKEIKHTGQPHTDAKYGLEMAYKLKSKFGDVVVRHKFGELSDAELEDQLAKEMAELASQNEVSNDGLK